MDSLPFVCFLVLLAASVAGWILGPSAWNAWRWRRVLRQPFPAPWRRVLRQRMPLFATLPAAVQQQLRQRIQILLTETAFIGCAGLVITDEMRVLIAAQASLLQLNRPPGRFAGLRQVLVYPGAFLVRRSGTDAVGLTHESRHALSGESWHHGQVVLSWEDVISGAAHPHDGRNVVIHEFAHQLDQHKGRANGAPWLGGPDLRARQARQARWARVLGAEFNDLQGRVRAAAEGAETASDSACGSTVEVGTVALPRQDIGVIDAYGATDPAEFFAVVSEHFFEQPQALATAHPQLYAEFSDHYRCDPRAW